MRTVLIIVAIALLIVLRGAFYVVKEPQQVVITQFGKPVGDPVTTPGLKVKVPLIQKVHRFDKRFLEWDGDANELPTKDKRFIWADTYARWRITDPLLFFQRLQNELGAQSRLDDILDGETRNAIANHELVELVRTSNRTPELDESVSEGADELAAIQNGRETIRREILAAAQTRTQDLGIEILDVQFKRINYVEEVQEKVYDRMIAERRRIADRFRSEGEGESARIRGELERDLNQIESEAFKTAEEIKGRADAEATGIYAAAYNRSADSRRFYEFLKSMETLEKTASPETSILLSTEGEFYRFLKGSGR
jgi:membrane protease subunit HflC